MVSREVEKKILELRRSGLSLREIAKRLNLSHSTVWRVLKKLETSQKQNETSRTSTKQVKQIEQSQNVSETVYDKYSIMLQNVLEHVKTLENNILSISRDVDELKMFQLVIQQVAKLRIEGPTRCKYIDEYGYCTRILLTECLPGTKCIEVILGDGTKMYRPKVVESPIICLACMSTLQT